MKKRIIPIAIVVLLGFSFFALVKAQVIVLPFFSPQVETEAEEDYPAFDTITGVLTKDKPLEELRKIATAYNKQSILSFSSKIYALKNNGTKPVEETSMLFEKSGGQQYYRIGNAEYVLGDSAFLMVNHDVKAMSLTKGVHGMSQDQLSQIKHMEEYLMLDSSTAVVSSSGDYKYITINNLNHPQVQQYVIKYSPSSFFVEEIRIYMAILQEEEATEENSKNEKNEAPAETEPGVADSSTATTLADLGLEQAVYRVVIRYSDYKSSFDFSDEHKIGHFLIYSRKCQN
jgi:hypothetical protein